MTAKQHLDLWRKGQQPLLSVVYSWMLTSAAEKCEITPGEEFRVALEEARKVRHLLPTHMTQIFVRLLTDQL